MRPKRPPARTEIDMPNAYAGNSRAKREFTDKDLRHGVMVNVRVPVWMYKMIVSIADAQSGSVGSAIRTAMKNYYDPKGEYEEQKRAKRTPVR